MNELDLIRELRADVALPNPAQLAGARGRLLEGTTASRRPRHRARWVPLVAALAVALAITVLAIPRTAPRTTPPPASHLSLAAQVLRAAALHAAAEPTTMPGADQWIYSKSVEEEPGSSVVTYDNWIQFDGAKTSYFQGGQLIVHTGPAPAPAPSGGASTALQQYDAHPTPMTAYDALSSLPTDATALLVAVDAEVAADPNSVAPAGASPAAGSTRQQLEFQYLSNLVWNAAQAAPASAEAAVFKAMATIPGVTAQPGVADATGRPAIALSDERDAEQLLFDPRTHQVTGLRTISNGHYPAPEKGGNLPAGTVVDSVAFVTVALVNAPGDR
jgi:hypothetical protein